MKSGRNLTVAFASALLLVALAGLSAPGAVAAPEITCYVSADPTRIPGEGLNTTLTLGVEGGSANATYAVTVNVTDPAGTSFSTNLSVTVNEVGSGENTTRFPGDFPEEPPSLPHTNYTGTYRVVVNETMAEASFTVGLTNATRYKRLQTVHVRGANYTQPDEYVWVNITHAGGTLYPANVTAVNGLVEADWTVPADAPLGTYTVTLSNATTPGTLKPVPDTQEFNVTGITEIKPKSGAVGTTVRVTGEIDTENGPYRLYFHNGLGESSVRNGTAEGFFVNDTFMVPVSVGGNRTVKLNDPTANTNATESFTVEPSYGVGTDPIRIQEGQNTAIIPSLLGGEANATYVLGVSVTDPATASHTADLTFETNETGAYSPSLPPYEYFIIYPANFTGATTDLLGDYIVAVNETLATGNFTVGLTDKLEYRAWEVVSIRGSGYYSNETVTVNIGTQGVTVAGYPKNLTADDGGAVTDSWSVPGDAAPGNYTVTLTSAESPGTAKTPPDTQGFSVAGVLCGFWVRNLDGEAMANVTVEARNATTDALVSDGNTNETGSLRLLLDPGNYSLDALWKDVRVGGLPWIVPVGVPSAEVNVTVALAHLRVAVGDESGFPVPFASVTVAYNYTTRDGQTVSEAEALESDRRGVAVETLEANVLMNISYLIEVSRYGYLLNQTLIENLTASRWANITCPTSTLQVHVEDSEGRPLPGVQVALYEWTTRIPARPLNATGEWGNASFCVTPGRYGVEVYAEDPVLGRVLLNETVVELLEGGLFLQVHSRISNLQLSVRATDYFGRPLPGARVEVWRGSVKVGEGEGEVSLSNVTGGDYAIHVYVRGELSETEALYLDESKDLTLRIGRYVAVGGYPVEAAQLATLASIGLLAALLGVAWAYRRLSRRAAGVGKPPREAG